MGETAAPKLVVSEPPMTIALEPTALHICAGPGPGTMLAFHADGRVTADPDLKPDEAAKAIINLLVTHGWLKYAPAPSPDRTVSGGLRESGSDYAGVAG